MRTDNLADDFRSEIVEADFFAHLLCLLQTRGLDVCQSSINIIAALVKFGLFIYHFAICKD